MLIKKIIGISEEEMVRGGDMSRVFKDGYKIKYESNHDRRLRSRAR